MECAWGKCVICTVLVRVVLRNTLKPQKARSESYLIVNLSDIVPDPISNMLIQLCDIFSNVDPISRTIENVKQNKETNLNHSTVFLFDFYLQAYICQKIVEIGLK